MKIEFDTTNLKATAQRLKQQVAENPLAAAAIGAATLNGVSALMNATTKRKNAKTERINAKAWDREVSRREKSSK